MQKLLHLFLKLPEDVLALRDQGLHVVPPKLEGVRVAEHVAERHVSAEAVQQPGMPGWAFW